MPNPYLAAALAEQQEKRKNVTVDLESEFAKFADENAGWDDEVDPDAAVESE